MVGFDSAMILRKERAVFVCAQSISEKIILILINILEGDVSYREQKGKYKSHKDPKEDILSDPYVQIVKILTLALQVNEFTKKFINSCNDFGVCLKSTLYCYHPYKFSTHVNV